MPSGHRPRRASRIALLFATLGLVGASVVASPLAAQADDGFTWSSTSQTVEYGSPWNATATISGYYCLPAFGYGSPYCQVTVDYSGTTSGSFTTSMYPTEFGTSILQLDVSLGGTRSSYLGVGGYRFVVTYPMHFNEDGTSVITGTSTPFQLTVTEAVVTTSLMVTADPLTARNAVVSVNLAGDFVESLGWFGPGMPAGTWRIVIVDADGKEAFRQEVPAAEGGNPYVVVPWAGVAPGTVFSGSAAFEVSGANATNFALTGGEASFSSATPEPTPTPTPTPLPSESAPTGLALPVWLLVLLAVVALGAAAAIVVLLARRRRTVLPLEEGATDAE